MTTRTIAPTLVPPDSAVEVVLRGILAQDALDAHHGANRDDLIIRMGSAEVAHTLAYAIRQQLVVPAARPGHRVQARLTTTGQDWLNWLAAETAAILEGRSL